jgi:hypothetical protein
MYFRHDTRLAESHLRRGSVMKHRRARWTCQWHERHSATLRHSTAGTHGPKAAVQEPQVTHRSSRRFSPSRLRVQCIGDPSPFVDPIRAQHEVDRVAEVLVEDPAQLPRIDPFAEYPLSCTSFPGNWDWPMIVSYRCASQIAAGIKHLSQKADARRLGPAFIRTRALIRIRADFGILLVVRAASPQAQKAAAESRATTRRLHGSRAL